MLLLQAFHVFVRARRIAASDAHLAQTRAFAHEHAEGARRDLRIERTSVLLANAVELRAVVSDQTGENVKASGRAFRISHCRHAMAKRQVFEQRHDVDTAALEHAAVADVHLMHRQVLQPLLDGRILARQEARANAIGDRAQSQIKTGRLKLSILNVLERADLFGHAGQTLELL